MGGYDVEALKTEDKQRPRAVDVLTGASSAVCMLFALGTTLTFATKLPQPRGYLSRAQSHLKAGSTAQC